LRYGDGMNPQDLDLVGTAEIANRCELEHGTVRQWRTRGHLPDPEWIIGNRPVWRWETVAAAPIVYRYLFEKAQRDGGESDESVTQVVAP
jgi:hypothetical protein